MRRLEQNIEYMASRMVYHCRREERNQRLFGSLPAFSLLTPSCLERGRDITDGGGFTACSLLSFCTRPTAWPS